MLPRDLFLGAFKGQVHRKPGFSFPRPPGIDCRQLPRALRKSAAIGIASGALAAGPGDTPAPSDEGRPATIFRTSDFRAEDSRVSMPNENSSTSYRRPPGTTNQIQDPSRLSIETSGISTRTTAVDRGALRGRFARARAPSSALFRSAVLPFYNFTVLIVC